MNIKLSEDKFKVSTNEKIIVFIVGLSDITELLLYSSIYEFIKVINFKQAVVAFRSICYLTCIDYVGWPSETNIIKRACIILFAGTYISDPVIHRSAESPSIRALCII